MRLPVLYTGQNDIILVDAEVQKVVIPLILISPHDTRGLQLPCVCGDFELDAEIAIAADDFIEYR